MRDVCIHDAFIFRTLVEREEPGTGEERRRKHGSNLARLKTAAELK